MRVRIRISLKTFISQSRARSLQIPNPMFRGIGIGSRKRFYSYLIVFLSYSDHSYSLFWFWSFKQQTLGKDLQNHRSFDLGFVLSNITQNSDQYIKGATISCDARLDSYSYSHIKRLATLSTIIEINQKPEITSECDRRTLVQLFIDRWILELYEQIIDSTQSGCKRKVLPVFRF
jgi:hypothetical protein